MRLKKYLMSGVAALAMGLSFTGCSGDDLFTQEDAIRNAQEVLGVSIDANRNWNMATQVTANVAVTGDYAVNYEVVIYENNPFVDNKGTVLAKSTVLSGSTASFDFTVPKGLRLVYVCLRDAKGYNYVKPVGIVDGKLETSFGGAETASTPSFFATRNGATRGTEADDFVIPEADVPFTAEEINAYMANATEPNDVNITHDNDNSHYEGGSEGHWVIDQEAGFVHATLPGFNWTGNAAKIKDNWGLDTVSEEDKQYFEENCRPLVNWTWVYYPDVDKIENNNAYIDLFWEVYNKLQNTGRSDWMSVYTWPVKGEIVEEVKHWEDGADAEWVVDTDWVLDFKITGNYDKNIPVAAGEDVYDNDGQLTQRRHRNIYISGKWTLPSGEQKIGGHGNVVILSGGELEIPADAYMSNVNQARLVVMPGGKITGAGKIAFTNGTAEDGYGYNGGTINIGTFTNNFGTMFNYGTMTVGTLEGPSTNSLYINHKKMLVSQAPKSSNTANMRIFNNCWFECTNGFACRNLVQGEGAYFKAENLEMSCSNDQTPDDAYIYAKGNSLIDVPGATALNFVNIVGPTGDSFAFLQLGYVENAYEAHGLTTATNYAVTDGTMTTAISNNVYLSIDNPNVTNDPYNLTACEKVINMLNGTNAYFYGKKMADQYAQGGAVLYNQVGNGNALLVRKGQYNTAAVLASECSPGITPDEPEEIEEGNKIWSYAFEDSYKADYDMNDVVLRVKEKEGDASKLIVTLCCTGASYNLKINLDTPQGTIHVFNGIEVHAALGCGAIKFVNTGEPDGVQFVTADFQSTEIEKPSDFTFGSAEFWIESPEGDIHVSKTGQDPHGILVPGDWAWPIEYISIREAYPQFSQYFIEGGVNEDYEEWYKYPAEGKVYIIQE